MRFEKGEMIIAELSCYVALSGSDVQTSLKRPADIFYEECDAQGAPHRRTVLDVTVGSAFTKASVHAPAEDAGAVAARAEALKISK